MNAHVISVKERRQAAQAAKKKAGAESSSLSSIESRFPGVLPSSRKAIVDIRMVTPMDVVGLIGDPADIEPAMPSSDLALVAAYADDMRNGRWVLNGQAIVFELTSPGKWRLVNGLKRLLAVHKARAAVPFVFVVLGQSATGEASLEASIDAHRMRRSADYVSMLEPQGAKTLSSALVHLYYWRTGAWKKGLPRSLSR